MQRLLQKLDSGREVVDVAIEAAICPKEEQAHVTTSNLVMQEQKISTSINYLSLIIILLILFILCFNYYYYPFIITMMATTTTII